MVLQLFVGCCKKSSGLNFLKSGTRILPVLTPYLPVFFLANPGFGMKTLGFHYPYPTRINPVFSRIENMGPYTLSQNGERLAESGIY